jgi:RNA polymerase sigma-70 factor, ECF subfamily
LNRPLPADLEDQELIHLTSGGNKEALGILYDRHASQIYSVLVQKLGDSTEAQDIVHDVFMKLYLKSHLYNPTLGSPVAWFLTLARNMATDRLRRQSTLQKYIEKEMLDTEPSVQAHSGSHVDEIQLMRSCLATLPQKQQSMLQMVYFSGLKQQEIADRMTEPLGSVKAWIRRGLLKLRDCMDGKL